MWAFDALEGFRVGGLGCKRIVSRRRGRESASRVRPVEGRGSGSRPAVPSQDYPTKSGREPRDDRPGGGLDKHARVGHGSLHN